MFVDGYELLLEAIHPYLAYGSVAFLLVVPFHWVCREVAGVSADHREEKEEAHGFREESEGRDQKVEDREAKDGESRSARPPGTLRRVRAEASTDRWTISGGEERAADYGRKSAAMPRVIVEVSGGVATVESCSDQVDILFFDWDELYERIGAEKCAVIQDALYEGAYDKARDLVDSVYNGEPWPPAEIGAKDNA